MANPASEAASTVPAGVPGAQAWTQVWQVPVLLLGAVLFGAGVWLAWPEKEPNNFPGRLDNVAYYLEANNLEKAHAALDDIARHIDLAPDATAADKARYLQYLGDLNFLQVQERNQVVLDTPVTQETFRRIAGYYAKAEELARQIDGKSTRRYAETLVALGRDDDALALVDRMVNEPAYRRYEIVRALIEKQRSRRTKNGLTAVTPLLERFKGELRREDDAGKRRAQDVWAASLEAELQIEAGDPTRAIDGLLVKIQRLTASAGGEDRDLAPLFVLLAQAYQMTADFDDAERLYRYAQQKLGPADGLNARILLGLGQIALSSAAENNVQTAMEHFTLAEKNYPSEPTYIDALIGRSDCEARLGAYPESIDGFAKAVKGLLEQSPPWDLRRQGVQEIVRSHIDRALDQEYFELALDYLTLLTPLHDGELPAPLLLDFAVIHENIAMERGHYADGLTQRLRAGDEGVSLDARRLAYQEAALHYEKAGGFYLRHARAVTVVDDAEHGASLWKAATCFDRSQDPRRAIDVYAEYVRTRQNDARRLAAIHQLGKAYLTDGQFRPAADLFLQLVTDHPNSPEAFDSLVPLAQTYIGLDQADAAERVLLQVVTDHPAITPESTQYQQALVELGKLYYRLGESDGSRHVQAIERLEEAVQRYGLGEDGPTLRYLLADAYRKSIRALDARLQERQSQSERLALQAERNRRLEQAQMFYNQAINELESRPQVMLTPLESLYRRNAYFYQADCAYDRGQFEAAIGLYDNAAQRWKNDPASLVALVQIVNAYCEMGQYQQAKVANEAARMHLERLPESAFDDGTLPMSRRHWEDWLRWSSELDLFASPRASADRATR